MLHTGMWTPAHHIEACLAALGTERFVPAFCDLVEIIGAHQRMVFSIEDDHARCLVSRHFSHEALGEELASTYLNGWFRKDPLLAELISATAGTVELRRFYEIEGRMEDEYRHIFFDRPGLVAKTTVLVAGDRIRLFINLYVSGDVGEECDADLSRLAGRLALLHFETMTDNGLPAPLAALSERERAVCMGILSGHKAEAIAAELGVAASTVVTYRKRAYNKLGITSRAGLFSICRP